ncbi:MAG: SDR family oxidoreductase [Bacteroidia bacterium]
MGPVLLTGATGFLGWHILSKLVGSRPVRTYVRNPEHPALRTYWGKVEIYKGDILDTERLLQAARSVETIIHSAAVISFSPAARAWMHQVNVQGTRNVVDVALEVGAKLIHISSIAALGRPLEGKVIHENTRWQESPYNTYYGYTKYLAEKEVFRGREEGLEVVVFRPGIILGDYVDWRKGSPYFFEAIYKGLKFYPVGINGFVGAQDVARAVAYAQERLPSGWGESYILVAGNMSYRQLFRMIATTLGVSPPRWALPKSLALGLGWGIEKLHVWLGIPALLTRETARTSSEIFRYDGTKIVKAWGFQYTPLPDVIYQTAQAFQTYVDLRKRR